MTDEPLAACEQVSVVYAGGAAEVRALDRVDIEIEAADSVALLGRSGSGKTTLLHILGGLVEPTEGRVLLHGGPLAALDRASRNGLSARRIAYVFQGSNLLPHFTALENIAFAAHLTRAVDPELAPPALLELVGLPAKADHLPAELSAGESQRVAIARALGQSPELLLCDEPTAHLDSDTGERVLDLIEALQHELRFALVIATHDVDIAARLGRPVEIHDGRILAGQPG